MYLGLQGHVFCRVSTFTDNGPVTPGMTRQRKTFEPCCMMKIIAACYGHICGHIYCVA